PDRARADERHAAELLLELEDRRVGRQAALAQAVREGDPVARAIPATAAAHTQELARARRQHRLQARIHSITIPQRQRGTRSGSSTKPLRAQKSRSAGVAPRHSRSASDSWTGASSRSVASRLYSATSTRALARAAARRSAPRTLTPRQARGSSGMSST